MGRPLSPATSERDDQQREPGASRADDALHRAESVVYAVAGLFLVTGAVLVMVAVGYRLATEAGDGVQPAVTAALDGLLLVFILLELLAGVRATMTERRLVAEPFLIVGIIASIKEIVVAALDAKELRGEEGPGFEHAMTEIGVLSVVVILLSLATYLVRRKEREPSEEDEG